MGPDERQMGMGEFQRKPSTSSVSSSSLDPDEDFSHWRPDAAAPKGVGSSGAGGSSNAGASLRVASSQGSEAQGVLYAQAGRSCPVALRPAGLPEKTPAALRPAGLPEKAPSSPLARKGASRVDEPLQPVLAPLPLRAENSPRHPPFAASSSASPCGKSTATAHPPPPPVTSPRQPQLPVSSPMATSQTPGGGWRVQRQRPIVPFPPDASTGAPDWHRSPRLQQQQQQQQDSVAPASIGQQ